MVKLTFYEYLNNEPETNSSKLFKQYFDLNKLPNKVCSSKTIYNILIPHDSYDSYNTNKKEIFKQTFTEYFRYKISLCNKIEKDNDFDYSEDKYIR